MNPLTTGECVTRPEGISMIKAYQIIVVDRREGASVINIEPPGPLHFCVAHPVMDL